MAKTHTVKFLPLLKFHLTYLAQRGIILGFIQLIDHFDFRALKKKSLDDYIAQIVFN